VAFEDLGAFIAREVEIWGSIAADAGAGVD